MKVGIFYSSISNPHKAPHKTALMDVFKAGVKMHGDTVVDFHNQVVDIFDLDAGFILGYTLENSYRKRIIDTLKIQKSKIFYVDSNIFSYGRSAHFYHRYSLNSVYPTDGDYFLNSPLDLTKWEIISKYHKLELRPWRENGNHIVVLAQKNLSWNMLGKNGFDWTVDIVKRIRKVTDRPIVIRLHPGDKKFNDTNRQKLSELYSRKNVIVSTNENIKEDLKNAWCSVGYNSTPTSASIIQGVPVFLDDPLNSWARGIGFENLEQIENPFMPDRSEWCHKIANIHWSNDEIAQGLYWQKFKSLYNY